MYDLSLAKDFKFESKKKREFSLYKIQTKTSLQKSTLKYLSFEWSHFIGILSIDSKVRTGWYSITNAISGK